MNETTKTFLTIFRHRAILDDDVTLIATELINRGRRHDLSKFEEDEFGGFVEINATARNFPYGSPEYKESIRKANEKGGCVNNHYARNSHHPEYYECAEAMSFLDIIEMVCDWHAAALTYGNTDFIEGINTHFKRFKFSAGQKWLILEVAEFIRENEHLAPEVPTKFPVLAPKKRPPVSTCKNFLEETGQTYKGKPVTEALIYAMVDKGDFIGLYRIGLRVIDIATLKRMPIESVHKIIDQQAKQDDHIEREKNLVRAKNPGDMLPRGVDEMADEVVMGDTGFTILGKPVTHGKLLGAVGRGDAVILYRLGYTYGEISELSGDTYKHVFSRLRKFTRANPTIMEDREKNLAVQEGART